MRTLIAFFVSAGLLAYTLQHFELLALKASITAARTEYLVISFFLLVFAYVLRGRRWMIWERNLKYSDSFKLIMIGFMGNNVMPARLGEVLRAHCTAEKTGKGYGRTAALASIAIERVFDALVIAFIGLAGLFLVVLERRLSAPLWVICVLFCLPFGFLFFSIYYHGRIRSFLERVNRVFPGHLTRFGMEKLNYFLDGLLLVRKPGRMLRAFLASGFIWGVELCVYYFVANAVLGDMSFEKSLIFLAAVNFASVFPFVLGGVGAIEGVAVLYLAGAGIPSNEALAMILIQHGFQFFFTTATGAAFYFGDRYHKVPFIQRAAERRDIGVDRPVQTGVMPLEKARAQIMELASDLKTRSSAPRDVYLSIVIPAYNESARLPKTVLEALRWCRVNGLVYEIVIVDDGSTDDTLQVARLFSDYDTNVKVIACPHYGKGAAVRMGMLNASGDYVLFMDADGSTPLDEIPKLLEKLSNHYVIAIGSRVVQKAGETEVVTSLHRRIIGRIFAALVNVFAVGGIGDTQCGFKMFKRDIIKDIFSRQKINGFAFDVEILFLAKQMSFPVSEVPVNWENKKGSKVNLVVDSFKMLLDILRIPILHVNL